MFGHERCATHALDDLRQTSLRRSLRIIEIAQKATYKATIDPTHQAVCTVSVGPEAWVKVWHELRLLH